MGLFWCHQTSWHNSKQSLRAGAIPAGLLGALVLGQRLPLSC